MAKYEIKHTCGHTETVNICGTNVHGERDHKIACLESKPCRECAAKAAAEDAVKAGLPKLSGSEKQVAWALDIRNEMIATLEDEGKQVIARRAEKCTDEQVAEVRANIAKAIGNVKAVKDAKWFIDNRYTTHFSTLFKLAYFLDEN